MLKNALLGSMSILIILFFLFFQLFMLPISVIISATFQAQKEMVGKFYAILVIKYYLYYLIGVIPKKN